MLEREVRVAEVGAAALNSLRLDSEHEPWRLLRWLLQLDSSQHITLDLPVSTSKGNSQADLRIDG